MLYELHLNLRQRAAVRVAISFWENKKVKDKVVALFESCDELKFREARNKWDELTKIVINEWNRDLLPQHLDIELIYIVKMIGNTIFNWYYYIKDQYGARHQAINCIDRIHWTSHGTIDAVKTFKTYWLNNPKLNITKKYNFACNHMLEDDINNLWNKMLRIVKSNYYNYDLLKSFDQHLISYWICCKDGHLNNLIRFFEVTADVFNEQYMLEFNFIYDLNRSTEENMLQLSAYQGHFLAVKYFWEKLTEKERDESIVKCTRIAVLSCYYFYKHYKINEYVEICIFLMNQMTDSHKKTFFNEPLNTLAMRFNGSVESDTRDEILQMLLSGWPWQELFMPILEDMIRLLDDDSGMVCEFLNSITKKMSCDYLPGYSIKMSQYRNLLHQVWLIIPGIIKKELGEVGKWHQFMNDLIDMWDLDSLKLIFNDPEIADVRDQYINIGRYSYSQLIVDDKIEIIDKFFKEIFNSEEEIKQLKKSIDLIDSFILNSDYHSAEKFLDWVYSTPEEKESKKKIEVERIFDDFYFDYDVNVLDKFLNWTCKTDEEKKPYKNRLKNDVNTMNWICEKWRRCNRNINKAKNECSQFLNWLLESEEEITILKKELFSAQRNQINLYVLSELNREGVMKDLFSWCMTSDEDIQQIERALSQQNRLL